MNLADKYTYLLELLRAVPGFSSSPMTIITLIAEIGVDMSVFPTSKHLTSWAGCFPRTAANSSQLVFRGQARISSRFSFRLTTLSLSRTNIRSLETVTAGSMRGAVTEKRSSQSVRFFSRRSGMCSQNLNL